MNPALATISCVEPEHALAARLAVREIQLKNNKLPVSAAPHQLSTIPPVKVIGRLSPPLRSSSIEPMRTESKEVEI
jgi:hypothetical protein